LALPRAALRVASDERLVQQLRAGSASAFEEIYERHHRGILAFCRHMLGSPQEAEDVVQHTFMAAYRSLLGEERQITLKAWLYVVARNRCLSLLRARREHADFDDEATVVPATVGLAVEVEGREDLRALLADVQRLPEDQRAALLFAELEAHSHEQIAVILDVPTAKVKALVFQARATLMSRRQARDADCDPIREQLVVLRGSALRRGQLRQHVEQCEGCRAFATEVRRQRAALGLVLPVVPSLALKDSTLAAAAAAVGSGAGGGSALLAGGTAAGATAGSAAGATAASVTAATASGGSAALTGAGALLGNVVAAKATIALAVTVVAGGGYAAVKQLPHDRSPAPPSHASTTASNQTPKPTNSTPVGGSGTSTDNCLRQPPVALGACLHTAPAKADRDANAISNRQNDCALKAANALSGCPKGALDRLPTGLLPLTDRLPKDLVPLTERLPTVRLPKGLVPLTERLPTVRLPKGLVPPTVRLPKVLVPPTERLPTVPLPKGLVPATERLPKDLVAPTERLPKGSAPPPERP
jgi:RNA polymerase sigma factor (sigma-70 family)